jgi:tetratricopeptide (TPR) repeat protein
MGVRAELRLTLNGADAVYALDAQRFTVGRDTENSLCVTDSVVSRFHAEFIRLSDDIVLRDLGSLNGTFVNGERVSEQILTDGDVIRLGKAGPEMSFALAEVRGGPAELAERRERATAGLIVSLSDKLLNPSADPGEEASLRIVLAEAHLAKGNHDAAIEVLSPYEVPDNFAALPEAEQAAVALAIARVRIERKENDRAVEALRGVLEYGTRTGDDGLLANTQAALGRALTNTGDLLGARDVLHRAMLGSRRAGNARLRAEVHLAVGRVDWKEGDLEAARFNWKRAGRLAEGSADQMLQAKVRLQQAFVLYAEGNLKEAAPAYEAAIAKIEAVGNVRLLLKAYSTLSRILTRLGSWTATERLLEDRLTLARQSGLRKAEAVALTDLAELRLLQGNSSAAWNVIQDAVRKHGQSVYARTQRILGRVLLARGRPGEAIAALEAGTRSAEASGALEEQILIGLELALACADARQFERARAYLVRAESITPLDPALNLMARALYTRGRVNAAEDQLREANRHLSQALSIFQTIGDPLRTAMCHAEIASIRARMGRASSARAHYEEAEQLFARLGASGELRKVEERLGAAELDHVEAAMTRTLSMTAPLSMSMLKPAVAEEARTAGGPRRVLVAEADEALCSLLVRGLEVENYRIDTVLDGRSAIERVESQPARYDMLLLDALLEHRSGFDVCREVRKRKLEMPIVLLGGRQGVEDKIEALQAGADDFIGKRGMVFEELLAKMDALLR